MKKTNVIFGASTYLTMKDSNLLNENIISINEKR